MYSLSCPWCSYETSTILPFRIPFTNSMPGPYWAGMKLGRHVKSAHPAEHDGLYITGDLEVIVDYLEENFNYGELDDVIEEIKEME